MSNVEIRIKPAMAQFAGFEHGVDQAIWQAAERLLGEANKTVPHATGALERSGDVRKANDQQYEIVYRTPYAVRQHEDVSLNHPDPTNPQSRPEGRAKWLEQTVEEQKDAIAQFITRSIRSRMGHAGSIR